MKISVVLFGLVFAHQFFTQNSETPYVYNAGTITHEIQAFLRALPSQTWAWIPVPLGNWQVEGCSIIAEARNFQLKIALVVGLQQNLANREFGGGLSSI